MRLVPLTHHTDGHHYGQAMAFSSDGRWWAAATTGVVHLWEGDRPASSIRVSNYVGGPPLFRDEGALRVGLWNINLATGEAAPLSVESAWLVAAIKSEADPRVKHFSTAFVAHVPKAERLVVLSKFHETRLRGDTYRYTGPRAQLLLVDSANDRLVAPLLADAHDLQVSAIAVGARYVAVLHATRVLVWDALTGARVPVTGQAPTADDGSADLVPRRGAPIGSRSPACDAVAMNRTGTTVAALHSDGSAALTSVDGASPRTWHVHAGRGGAVAFHPAGQLLATGARTGLVQLWDLAAVEPGPVATHQAAGVGGLCFHPDGDYLLIAGDLVHHDLTRLALQA